MLLPAAVFCNLHVEGRGEPALAELATAQGGVVHRRQLEDLGIGRGSISHRLSRGKLHLLFPSVFAIGHRWVDPTAILLAALFYAGNDAVVSHASAAWLWGLTERSGAAHVTRIGAHVRAQPGLRTYRVGGLDLRDACLRDGLPVTSPARTLLDLAAGFDDGGLTAAVAEARVKRLVTDRALLDAVDRAPRRTGGTRLRALLRSETATAPTRSEAERRMLKLIYEAQLPAPEVNVRLQGFEVDFLWRKQRLIVEMDGFAFHGHRRAFQRDRRRDQILEGAGYTVFRVTWQQLVGEPLALAVRLANALVRH